MRQKGKEQPCAKAAQAGFVVQIVAALSIGKQSRRAGAIAKRFVFAGRRALARRMHKAPLLLKRGHFSDQAHTDDGEKHKIIAQGHTGKRPGHVAHGMAEAAIHRAVIFRFPHLQLCIFRPDVSKHRVSPFLARPGGRWALLFFFRLALSGGTRAQPKVNGAQERCPRRAAQRHNPSWRGAQGRPYCVYYIILPFEIPLLFCENAPVFRRPSGQKKKSAPAQEKRSPSPRAASLWGGGWRANPVSRKVRARRRSTRGAFPQKRPSRPRKKIALAQEKSTPRPSEQARPNKSFSPTQKAAPKPFRIWEQPCLFIFLFIRSPSG